MEELELEQAEAERPLCSGPSPSFSAVGSAPVLLERKSCRSSFQLALFSLSACFSFSSHQALGPKGGDGGSKWNSVLTEVQCSAYLGPCGSAQIRPAVVFPWLCPSPTRI